MSTMIKDISEVKKDMHELDKGVYKIKAYMKLTRTMFGLSIAILIIPFLKNFVLLYSFYLYPSYLKMLGLSRAKLAFMEARSLVALYSAQGILCD
ncbi:MAG: hypothetical protein GQ581_02315 [Methyloprofundus sp.]|nr:hypothetical protein [Methyloprofundus sp.]